MTYDQFRAITADIEEGLEGDGYEIEVTLSNGEWKRGSWSILGAKGSAIEPILVLSHRDTMIPPIYVSLSEVVTITRHD